MKEYIIYFVGNNGRPMFGYFYGKDEHDAKAEAVRLGVSKHKITKVEFKEAYRGYGHI